jgi:predicted hydrocarbon binding protein
VSDKSGFYYPNKGGRISFIALEEVMGKNGINAVLHMAKLSHFIDNYPPDDLKPGFDFADFGALNQALEDMYGPRGARGLALRMGRAAFAHVVRDFGPMVGMADLAFKVLPLSTKLKVGTRAMAEAFSKVTDQITRVEEDEEKFIYIIERCPVCWGRKTDRPVCFQAVGILQEGLRWVSGGKDFRVEETLCIAKGDPTCTFIIDKEPIG